MTFHKPCFIVPVGKGREATYDRFKRLADEYAPGVDVIPFFDTEGVGCGTARYHLWELVRKDYDFVMSLDDDCELSPQWWDQVRRAYDLNPDVNCFTTTVWQNGNIYASGMNIERFPSGLTRGLHVNKWQTHEIYGLVDWAIGGCTIFCRKALTDFNPRPIHICEDYDWYGFWREAGLGPVISIRDAMLDHNVKDNPRVAGFRDAAKLLESAKMIYRWHKINIIFGSNAFKYHCGVDDVKELDDLMERVFLATNDLSWDYGISVVILSRGMGEDLRHVLNSCLSQQYSGDQVFVVSPDPKEREVVGDYPAFFVPAPESDDEDEWMEAAAKRSVNVNLVKVVGNKLLTDGELRRIRDSIVPNRVYLERQP